MSASMNNKLVLYSSTVAISSSPEIFTFIAHLRLAKLDIVKSAAPRILLLNVADAGLGFI